MSFFNETGAAATSSLLGTVKIPADSGLSITTGGDLTNSDKGSDQNIFKTVIVGDQGSIEAVSNIDTLTFVAGARIGLTIINDQIVITDTALTPKTFRVIDTVGNHTHLDVICTTTEDRIEFVEGPLGGITLTTNQTDKQIIIENSGIVSATSGTGISLTTTDGVLDISVDGSVSLTSSSIYIGTTDVLISRPSANLSLTGISSVELPGATSGSITLTPASVAGTNTAITVPATTGTMAVQTIGSWTPTLTFATTQGLQTYTSRVGTYIKIGNLVTATFTIQTSTIGAAVGNVRITGLPTVSRAGVGNMGTVTFGTVTASRIGTYYGSVPQGSTGANIFVTYYLGGMQNRAATAADLGNLTSISGTITYISA